MVSINEIAAGCGVIIGLLSKTLRASSKLIMDVSRAAFSGWGPVSCFK